MRKVLGGFLAVTAFVVCPCHLPLTLGVLLGVLVGTAIGSFMAAHTGLVYGVAAGYFILGIAVGYYLLTRKRRVVAASRGDLQG